MATTRYAKSIVGGLPKTARFSVTADNDVLLEGDDMIVIAAYYHDANVTALNIDAGADIVELPAMVTKAQQLCVTAAGAGDVTLVFASLPAPRYDTYDV